MLLALALYIFDSMFLLHSREAVLIRSGKGWRAVFGSFHWRLGGKEPCLPNPFTPYRAVVKLEWQLLDSPDKANCQKTAIVPGLQTLALLTCGSGLMLFLLLPLSLFAHWGAAVTLTVICALYVINIAALTLLYRIHRTLKAPGKSYWSTVFECLICPPFCINLIRRVYAWRALDEDFLDACHRLLTPEELASVHASCLARVDEQIAFETDDSPRMNALQQSRARFLQASQS